MSDNVQVSDRRQRVEGLVEVGSERDLGTLLDAARGYASLARADATRRAYRADWQSFSEWCTEHGRVALPATPSTVASYLAALADAGRKPSTIRRALTGVSEAHRAAGFASPRTTAPVLAVMAGIQRRVGVAPTQKHPVLAADLRRMVASLPGSARGLRDRAILLVGFAGALRRSEVVALDVADVAFGQDGVTVTVRRSKTDQVGAGRKIGIPYGSEAFCCPVRTLRAWLDASGSEAGPLFGPCSARAVARLVKRAARNVGLDPSQFSGHSLRAGHATSAAIAGKSESAIMRQTGHRSHASVRGYIRDAALFRDNSATGLL
jgi:integrase